MPARHDEPMQIGIYRTTQRDSLVALLAELAEYYGHGDQLRLPSVGAHLDTVLTGPSSPLVLVTATDPAGGVVGLAALILQPSLVDTHGPGRMQCQLKELFVSQTGRGSGTGEQLLRWCARYAQDHDCGRIDWHVRAENQAGIRFYERLGARRVVDRVSYRIEGTALPALAGPSPNALDDGG